MRFTTPSTARQINRLRVLNLLALKEGLSRADVSRLLDLNKVSTSEIVDALLTEGLLKEGELKTTTIGRPPTALLLQKEKQTVFAIDLEGSNTSVALVNLMGEMLRFERFPTQKDPKPELIAASIIQTVKKFLAKMRDPQSVAGLVISLNAVVEGATGTVLSAPQWGWENVPLAYALSKHLPFKVAVENSTKALIFGERWFGDLEAGSDFFYVNWGESLSGAYFSGGKVQRESLLGHIPIGGNKRCRCGANGCLETVSGGWSLLEQFPEVTSLKQLFSLKRAQSSLLTATANLAKALVYVAAIQRPSKIVIGGAFSALPSHFMEVLQERFRAEASSFLKSMQIEKSSMGDQSGVLGAASIALDEFVFKRSLLERTKTAFR